MLYLFKKIVESMVKNFSTEIITDTTSFIVEVNWTSKEELISIQELAENQKRENGNHSINVAISVSIPNQTSPVWERKQAGQFHS